MKKVLYGLVVGSLFIYGIHAQASKKVTLAPPALYNFGLNTLDRTKAESRKMIAALFAWLQYKDEERADELATLNSKDYYPGSTDLVEQEEKKVQQIVKDNGATWDKMFNEQQAAARELKQCKDAFQQAVAQDKKAIINTLNRMVAQ